MFIILKLLGYSVIEDDITYSYVILIRDIECFSYKMIKKYFIDKNFNEEFLDNNIKFIYNNISIDDDKIYIIEDNKAVKINIYTNETSYKNKLIHFFLINGIKYSFSDKNKIENNIKNNIEKIVVPEKINKLSVQEIKENNNNFFNILNDDDLLKLIKIYNNKPELFKILYLIESNNNIINEPNEESIYDEECFIKLKNIFTDLSDNYIIDALKKYNNICSLTFKYLLKNK